MLKRYANGNFAMQLSPQEQYCVKSNFLEVDARGRSSALDKSTAVITYIFEYMVFENYRCLMTGLPKAVKGANFMVIDTVTKTVGMISDAMFVRIFNGECVRITMDKAVGEQRVFLQQYLSGRM